MRTIVLIAHNIRSCHNVGSLLRTAEGLGVKKAYLTGYTPYPISDDDDRLPHIALKIDKQIQKTALGAQITLGWEHNANIFAVISSLKNDGFTVAAIEQTPDSIGLPTWEVPDKIAFIVGRETEGLEQNVLVASDVHLEIPMFGQKESFNVVQAAAMALFHGRFSD